MRSMCGWSVSMSIVLVACGGASPPPARTQAPPAEQSAPAEQAPPAEPSVDLSGYSSLTGTGDVFAVGPVGPVPPTPTATPPPTPKPRPASPVPRLRDADGPVPGLEAFVTTLRQDSNHCGGFAIETTRDANQAIANADVPLAALFEIPALRGLNFSLKNKRARAVSKQRFDTWVAELARASGAARDHYSKALATTDAQARVIALARLAQISYRMASLLVRMETPIDVRTGDFADEKIEAFCDRMAEVVEPLLGTAEQLAAECALAAAVLPAGWWTEVCKAP